MTIVNKLIALKEQVQKATARIGDSDGRPVPIFWEREFLWTYGNIPTTQMGTLTNYAPGEVRLHAIGSVVEMMHPTTGNIDYVLTRTSGGYSYTNATADFDFEWNISYNSSNAMYGVSGHADNSPYLSSECFRGERWGNRFEISPLRLGLNESITIRVNPTLLLPADGAAAYVLRLRFQFWGTRAYV